MTELKLHIGGKIPHPDWKIVDIEPRPEVDYVTDASDLSLFESNSVGMIYASHILEHFHYKLNDEVLTTLKEWHRVLKPGGKLLVSVPDLKTLCWLYLNPNFLPEERLYIMTIIFGGHENQYDVHRVGFDFETLGIFIAAAGFESYEQISEFNLFPDCSTIRVLDTLVSLNVIATK